MPPAPAPSGSPVLSIYQSDAIYYGADLMRYLLAEWAGGTGLRSYDEITYRVPFWSDLIEDG